MEEVLYSVKQKHREKHKRKREEKRRAALLAETEERPPGMDVREPKPQPLPLREKAAQENGLKNGKRKSSPLKCSTPVAEHHSILKHFPKTGRPENGATAPPAKAKSATNVFEFMMNARNRSIGVNDGGRDASESPADQADDAAAAGTPTSKRKQLLQDWNDRKGGAKRRLQEEAREDYIDQQMDQRAKRLKKMLTRTEEPKEPTPAASSAPTVPVKRGRGRPRTRRLSSVDVGGGVGVGVVAVSRSQVTDTDTAEFLAKLSSPTKKRDSLLGYFPKVESPKELPVTIETPPLDTPKRRPQRRKSIVETASIDVESTGTPPGRPRRSCAGKARYDYDLETSPTKAKASVAAAAAKNMQKADESIEIIDLDNSNPVSTPKKLAPLFVRQLPKPSPDPSVLKARQAFLQSGVPEKIRQEQIRQKNFEQYYEESYEVFPSIAHVGCESYETIRDGSLRIPFPLRKEDDGEEVSLPSYKRRSKASGFTNCQASDWHQAYNNGTDKAAYTTLPQLDNKRAFVKLWKNEFERFPTFKCYNQMREKYRHFSAIDSAQDTQQMGESFVVTRRTLRSMEQFDHGSTEEAQPPLSAPNGELLFTEKYKPLLFEQVLVNLTPVHELREFLSGWNGNGGRSSQTFDDSSFDFGNDSSSVGATSNTIVLVGPSSSGKTNAVIALANDMNFNVLEINAGMKRTGKKLIQELQEATQSHQIRKDSKTGGGSSQQLLHKLQKSGLKAKKQQQQQQQGEPAGVEAVRKSLILIEDADILFDNMDAGFTDAIYTLAASSKRPVVVVASDPNCSHLQRMMQQNQIHFQAPNALNISRFLAVLALMENCPIELDELISLYLYNQQNLRKTLMELQFYIQSGGDLKGQAAASQQSVKQSPSKSSTRLATVDGCHIHQRLFEFFTCSQNVQHRIPFPVDFRLLRLNLSELMATSALLKDQQQPPPAATRASAKRKTRSPKKAWLSSATSQRKSEESSPLATLAAFYDNISLAALMDANQDCGDRLQLYLSEDISHMLVEQALLTGLEAKECAYNLFDKPAQRVTIGEHLGIGQLRSAASKALDYEPVLRSICRSERERVGQERKSSRFYHYLRNHTVNVTSFAMDSFDSACSVFQEAAAMADDDSKDHSIV
ncbi:ATPase family AAA domain-containing protein 5 isoform X2 [Drosophila obscura]|nr:ATPase family AAA domain-containing protein 5 isoform X2 [Drosophila obscura]